MERRNTQNGSVSEITQTIVNQIAFGNNLQFALRVVVVVVVS